MMISLIMLLILSTCAKMFLPSGVLDLATTSSMPMTHLMPYHNAM